MLSKIAAWLAANLIDRVWDLAENIITKYFKGKEIDREAAAKAEKSELITMEIYSLEDLLEKETNPKERKLINEQIKKLETRLRAANRNIASDF